MNPYLNFNGNCREALGHYQQVLGAKLLFQHTWAESPMADQMPEGQGDAIMHATLQFPDGSLLMAAEGESSLPSVKRLKSSLMSVVCAVAANGTATVIMAITASVLIVVETFINI